MKRCQKDKGILLLRAPAWQFEYVKKKKKKTQRLIIDMTYWIKKEFMSLTKMKKFFTEEQKLINI